MSHNNFLSESNSTGGWIRVISPFILFLKLISSCSLVAEQTTFQTRSQVRNPCLTWLLLILVVMRCVYAASTTSEHTFRVYFLFFPLREPECVMYAPTTAWTGAKRMQMSSRQEGKKSEKKSKRRRLWWQRLKRIPCFDTARHYKIIIILPLRPPFPFRQSKFYLN